MTTYLTRPPSNNSKAKWSFGKTLLILCGICSAYAWLIPTNILTENPGLLPFVNVMESILPAIKGFARASPVPEVVRFYYATMWIAFPIVYLFVRVRWMDIFEPLPVSSAPRKNATITVLFSVLICASVSALMLLVMGLHEIPNIPIRPIAISGRGNALFAALAVYPLIFGIASAVLWSISAITIELAGHGVKYLFSDRQPY